MKKIVNPLYTEVKAIIENAKHQIVRNINTIIVYSYFQIGKRIVEYDQQGKKRADYAEETIKTLSHKLTRDFGKGYSMDNLEKMRKFYLMYGNRISG